MTICHLPPGTSKWNKIEHRLFSHISMNWRGRPLISHEVVVKLIGATMTKTGLNVKAKLDKRKYPRSNFYHIRMARNAMRLMIFLVTPGECGNQ